MNTTTTHSKTEASRLKFELAISGFDGNPDLTRTPKGYYADFSVQRSYLGWLAALLQVVPPAETFKEELDNMTALWSIAHAERSEALTKLSELTAAHEEETTALKERPIMNICRLLTPQEQIDALLEAFDKRDLRQPVEIFQRKFCQVNNLTLEAGDTPSTDTGIIVP